MRRGGTAPFLEARPKPQTNSRDSSDSKCSQADTPVASQRSSGPTLPPHIVPRASRQHSSRHSFSQRKTQDATCTSSSISTLLRKFDVMNILRNIVTGRFTQKWTSATDAADLSPSTAWPTNSISSPRKRTSTSAATMDEIVRGTGSSDTKVENEESAAQHGMVLGKRTRAYQPEVTGIDSDTITDPVVKKYGQDIDEKVDRNDSVICLPSDHLRLHSQQVLHSRVERVRAPSGAGGTGAVQARGTSVLTRRVQTPFRPPRHSHASPTQQLNYEPADRAAFTRLTCKITTEKAWPFFQRCAFGDRYLLASVLCLIRRAAVLPTATNLFVAMSVHVKMEDGPDAWLCAQDGWALTVYNVPWDPILFKKVFAAQERAFLDRLGWRALVTVQECTDFLESHPDIDICMQRGRADVHACKANHRDDMLCPQHVPSIVGRSLTLPPVSPWSSEMQWMPDSDSSSLWTDSTMSSSQEESYSNMDFVTQACAVAVVPSMGAPSLSGPPSHALPTVCSPGRQHLGE